mmetsp:Transcript_16338/g.22835  ORF Transcript_16338/g.22835 Transcript_16338/m.22835 type:complete len:93 (+) Transcript_16338:1680-1958(+)
MEGEVLWWQHCGGRAGTGSWQSPSTLPLLLLQPHSGSSDVLEILRPYSTSSWDPEMWREKGPVDSDNKCQLSGLREMIKFSCSHLVNTSRCS